ncbi:ImmA/IrrE family metallo-endopeptidase [Rhodococcus zopfii]|uniref:ImmA/IrrE family metallo-endopeptidase n=1 Tax=Rhodococcus zopfii TaxID=43772 RepID=A0ABU3WU73_9NOCA|nr:ImmA/IrrE family metallo-endopeptidase [Rhodococcus zopfii]
MGRLVSAAATLGVTIVEGRPLRGRPGHYDDETRTIVLRPGLPRRRRRGVLGHELGHAYYKHIRCGDPYLSARQERQADEYAARLLITPEEYARAEQIHGPNVHMIAYELDVTRPIVVAWQNMYRAGRYVSATR